MPRTKVVWTQFAMQVFRKKLVPPLKWAGELQSVRIGATGYSGRATLVCFFGHFFGKTYRLATIHTLLDRRQTDRRTQRRTISATFKSIYVQGTLPLKFRETLSNQHEILHFLDF